jgi:two-component system, chemotaxis family, sensor kinase CheA
MPRPVRGEEARVGAIDEIVAEFLVESHENLDQLDRDLLALERNPQSPELLAGVFRTIHTIKGTSGSLAFGQLERLTHVAENLLSRLRDGSIDLTHARAAALLQTVDAVRALLAQIEATGGEGDADHSELLATLSALLEDDADIPEAVDGALESQAQARAVAHRSVLDGSVRVDAELLDSLLRLVGNLVVARDDLVACLPPDPDPSLARSARDICLITEELRTQVLKTRMQPVDAVWSKMPRVVRQLARTCGRQVRLEMEGHEAEVDRSVLDAVKDPLMHLVRNAVDHGIEPPDDRVKAGKPTEGVLLLRAYCDARHLHLEVSEDGAGIDPERIAAVALERGLVSRAQLARMTGREILDLIFLPGFSTAPAVTNVSGRGVGMDVVKTRIEAIGGSVDVASTVGEGSTIRLTAPRTLAMIPAPRGCRCAGAVTA